MDNKNILNEAMNLVQSVKDGEVNALDVYGDLNELKKGIDELRKEIYNETIDEIQKYDRKEDVIRGNFNYSVGSRTNYKYGQDAEYKMIKQKLKNRKEMIKAATQAGKDLTDSETGEICSPVDSSRSIFPKVTYNQKLN